ncbi:MAG: hypothetical protein JSV45_09780 [Chromatiales bacterium]|nr:MAG: hypothetical protein JSV45_09780 [Chromatiales bacterium]
MHKGLLTIATLTTLALAIPATAEIFYDEARVIATQPVYAARQVPVEVQECGYEQPATPNPVDPAMLGDARAVDPGAGLLGALDQDIELRKAPAEVYRCRMVTRMEAKQELAGYQVRYEYTGRVYERRVAQHPGDTIRVSVGLSASQPGAGRHRAHARR